MSMFEQHCPACGIYFGYDSGAEAAFRKANTEFYCPNGHQLRFPKPQPEESELPKLRAKVKALQADLDAANAKIAKLTSELELWAPRKESVA